jgi:hypothetical protein
MEKIKTFSKPEIEKRINVFPYWYHKIELPHGVVTQDGLLFWLLYMASPNV